MLQNLKVAFCFYPRGGGNGICGILECSVQVRNNSEKNKPRIFIAGFYNQNEI
jgi:hypothetical protein